MFTIILNGEGISKPRFEDLKAFHQECEGEITIRSENKVFSMRCSGCGKTVTLAKSSDILFRMTRITLEGEYLRLITPDKMLSRKLVISG